MATKKCRIYAAFGVSQTPNKSYLERRKISYETKAQTSCRTADALYGCWMAVPAFAANGPRSGTTVLHTSGSVIRRMGIRRSLPTAARLTMYQVLFMIRRATPLP